MKIKCWLKEHPEINQTLNASEAIYAVHGFIWKVYKNQCHELTVCTEDENGVRQEFLVEPRYSIDVYEQDVV